jgi:hypothetical protein
MHCSARPPAVADGHLTRNFYVSLTCFGALCGQRRSSCSFGLRASGFLCAERFHADRLEARCLGGDRFLLRRQCGGGFRRGGHGGRMLFGGGGDVGSFAPAPDWFLVSSWNGFRHDFDDGARATASRRRRRRRLLFSADALLTFPASADASDLVVGEHAHVAANGNVHLPKKGNNFFGGHREFVGQLTD